MKTVKSLLLGAAAGFVALTGAQAADLPGKAAPAEYVRICDTYGAGFFFIPGTDTCLRIGGYVRMDAYLNQSFAASNTVYSTRTRLLLNFDARSNTEYGLLRAYGEFLIQRGPGNNVLPMNVAVGAGATGQASAAYMSRAFIQFAGFTFGNSASFFNFYQGDLQFVASSGAAMDPSRNSSNLIAYTASFGSGFSATISVEDPQFRRLGTIATVTGGAPFVWANPINRGLLYSGQQMPDVVANLRVDQGWGSAQVMAAYHEVRGGAAGGAVFSKAGFAVGGGVRLNLDMLARGDVLWLQATYADGALGYVFTNDNSDGLIQTRQTIGTGLLTAVYADGAVNVPVNGLVNSKAWGIHGGFRHFWTPALRSAIWGKYINIDSPGAVAAGLVGDGAALSDIRFWQVGVNTIWSPVRNLDLGVEVVYSNLRARDNGSGLTAAAGGGIGNASAWSGMFRVQRNF